jgi:hypothetical protein
MGRMGRFDSPSKNSLSLGLVNFLPSLGSKNPKYPAVVAVYFCKNKRARPFDNSFCVQKVRKIPAAQNLLSEGLTRLCLLKYTATAGGVFGPAQNLLSKGLTWNNPVNINGRGLPTTFSRIFRPVKITCGHSHLPPQ